jgi:tetratricopeptide (TPR) repeat protein
MLFLEKQLTRLLLIGGSLLSSAFLNIAHAEKMELTIDVKKPVFVLPQFTGPYQEREASIAPEEYEAAENLRMLLESGKKDEVLAELKRFYDLELSPAMLALKAQLYFSLKKYDDAEKTYLAVLARQPQLVRAHSDLGQLYLLKENYTKAREHFAHAVSYGSNEAIIHGQLAYLNLTLYGAFSAISEYQQAMALEPENPQWQQGLLAALSQAKMYESASALIREMLGRHPDKSELWINQAALALKMDDRLLALSSLEMAILLGDDNENNLRTAAQLHLQLNSYDRALSLLEKHLSKTTLNMETLNQYLHWLGQVEMWSQADRLLDKAQQQLATMNDRDQSMFYHHRARVSKALNNFNNADQFFSKSLDKNPVNGDALLDYAQFCGEQKQHVKAELLYTRAESIKSKEKQALLGKAQLYLDMQDYESALTHLKSAYNKFPELYDLKDNIDSIQNIIRSRQQSKE